MTPLDIRMYSWFHGGLSWAYVMARLAQAFEELGNNVYFTSTNGISDNDNFVNKERMLKSVLALQEFGIGKKQISIDLTYTVPQNFPARFLPNSKNKCAIYNYETTYWPEDWKKYYHIVNHYFPSSNFSAEIFYTNGVPKEKIFVIPHGIDTNMFNPNIPKIKLRTNKKFKFICVAEPHYRKNLELLLNAYCEAFTSKDDVCLVLKTKVYKYSDGDWDASKNPKGRKAFEIVLGDVFKRLYDRFGKNIPEIELLSGHVENVSSIYNVGQCHITTTGAEGFFMPGLEAMACGLINIAPSHSGHLDFLNENNSLLIDTKLRYATHNEQYWMYNPKSMIGEADKEHTKELMHKVVNEYNILIEKFRPEMEKMVNKLTWKYAAQLIIDAIDGKLEHYVPGTYKGNI